MNPAEGSRGVRTGNAERNAAVLQAGTSFGKYRILSFVGRGGMGVVYLAEDTILGRRIALKVLDRSITEDVQLEKRFRQEARAIADFQHPNIVPIHSLEKVDDTLAIDMPYIDGGSLCDALAVDAAKRPQTLESVRGVLSALACCHGRGLVHRDVKPSNILIRNDGTPLLSDFGLAKILAEQQSATLAMTSTSGFFVGTPRYAPPESWDGQDATPSWDVYSVGMVLYEAFAPRLPYDAQTPMGLVKQILERKIPPLAEVAEDVSEEFSGAVARMLDRDPGNRPPDAAAAAALLGTAPEWKSGGFDSGATVMQRVLPRIPEPPESVPHRPRRRMPWAVAAAVASGIVLVALALVLEARTGARPGEGAGTPAQPVLALETTPSTVFDTIEPASGEVWPRHLLLLAPENTRQWTALAYEGARIWALEVSTQNPETLHIEGHWAGYADRAASVFQQGDVTGTGRWIVPNEELSLALEFNNLLDGVRKSGAFICRKTRGAVSDTDFLAGFASDDFALPLLYNEILPRGLEWGEDVETAFLARLAPRLVAFRLPEGAGPITIDGTLDEAIWKSSSLNPGFDRTSRGDKNRLWCLYDSRGLYVSARMSLPEADPELVLTVLARFEVPVSYSTRWSVLYRNDGIRASRAETSGRSVAWQCEWETGLAVSSGVVQTEVFIPFANLGYSTPPKPGDRWRLLGSAADAPNAANAGQGVILVFGTESAG